METENKCITVVYKLYTTENGERELIEEATEKHPFQFITSLGTTLDIFENQIKGLNKGDKFEFTIPCADAYGEYNEEHVINLPKNIFEVNG
ncbi:FKBP-type peptidyl-prolyl cis-trans isomerase SlyD, partial [termite gut metagenome]